MNAELYEIWCVPFSQAKNILEMVILDGKKKVYDIFVAGGREKKTFFSVWIWSTELDVSPNK